MRPLPPTLPYLSHGYRALTGPRKQSLATLSQSLPVNLRSQGHKVVIVGGGSAGLTIGHQLLRSGRFARDDIAIIDPSEWHDYQAGWTLVGAGLKDKDDLRKPLKSLIDPKICHYADQVQGFRPEGNTILLGNNKLVTYDQLVVCPGIYVDFESIKGLSEAVRDPQSPVSSTYSYQTCDKVALNIAKLKKGNALFSHPIGLVKCAGAPQKIMWLALDGWRRAGLYNPDPSKSDIQISFATAMPVMFGVTKYSQKLNELRDQRGVEGLFEHDLIAIEGNTAIMSRPDGQSFKKHFDFLHAVPKMRPYDFVKKSALANDTGLVDVDQATLRHKSFENVWSCGDAAGLQTSKTAAAITAQAPVLVANLLSAMEKQPASASYNGYTSCPLPTEYGKLMLAEFVYGGKPHETFGAFIDQAIPRRAFYHLKKDFFPWVYYKSMVKGTWAGPKGWLK